MLPHFRTALKISRDTITQNDSFRIFPLEELPQTRRALSQMLADWFASRTAFPEKSRDSLAARCAKWIQLHLNSPTLSYRLTDLHSFQGKSLWLTCSLRLIPPTSHQPGAVVIHTSSSKSTANPDHTNLPLTNREYEVARWLCEGKTNGEMALILNIRPGMVKRHLENIYEKLGVPNRLSAVRMICGK